MCIGTLQLSSDLSAQMLRECVLMQALFVLVIQSQNYGNSNTVHSELYLVLILHFVVG